MEFTKEEIVKSNDFLRKKSMACSNAGKPINKEVLDLLDDNMSSDDFNQIILTKLCYENKHKLVMMISQKRYNQSNPSKQLKFKKKISDKFLLSKGDKQTNEFLEEVIDFYNKYKGKIDEEN